MSKKARGADLITQCLEVAGIRYVFGLPGEENMDFIDSLNDSSIKFVMTRHEQSAAFMADVYGRLTGKIGVCTATLGPGATNLITGIADAYLDHAPLLAIVGQGATNRLHKESHQIIELTRLFESITKYSRLISETEAIIEIISTALVEACSHKPGPVLIVLPENIAGKEVDVPRLASQDPVDLPLASDATINKAQLALKKAKKPLILIGNGAVRNNAARQVTDFINISGAPFTTTFMAKGTVTDEHPLRLMTTGLSDNEHTACGFDQADLVITIGYDLVEFDPGQWHQNQDQLIIHIDSTQAEIDRNYMPAISIIGDIANNLASLTMALKTTAHQPPEDWSSLLRTSIQQYETEHVTADEFPVKPQRLLHDLRQVMARDDILISDVGAHKVWIAHLWHSLSPNTCVISNGFASMGISLPGAIAAKLAFPERMVVVATGDAGFMMNVQELETALRLKMAFIVLVWNDSGYGLIEWHQQKRYGYSNDVKFNNPDFVTLAESFGAKGFRVKSAEDLALTLKAAADCGTVAVIDCPVDYTENMRLTERLGSLTCIN